MLKVENLSIKTSERVILSNISFTLETGNVYSILGKNGEGKSVLLKSCSLLLDKNHFIVEGKIYFNDKNLFTLSKDEINKIRKSEIRYVFQDAVNTFDPLRKIAYYFRNYSRKGEFGIDNIFDQLLLGDSEKILASYPYEVSTGQAQRICFALSILAKPKIIILDEPTSALDQINGNIYLNLLSNIINENITVLVVTHDFKFALKASNKIAMLKNGNLSEFKSPDKFEFQSDHSYLTT